jgi:hypothetical protein
VEDLEQALDRLYAVEPSDFVAERDRLARELRKAGDRDAAEQVKGLRKPTVSAWTVNQLTREARREIDLLLDAGHRLRGAQQALLTGEDPRSFDEARRNQREALGSLRRSASRILADAGRASEVTLNRVMGTLQAAAVSAEGRELLARGRLTEDLEATGFEALAPLAEGVPAKSRPRTGRQAGTKAAPRERRRQQNRQRLVDARRELREAQAAAKAAQKDLRAAEQAADKARREFERAEARMRETEAATTEARTAASQAEKRLREAERKVR